jgi:acetyltransferase
MSLLSDSAKDNVKHEDRIDKTGLSADNRDIMWNVQRVEAAHMTMRRIKAMFNPRTIALVGRIEEEGSEGQRILENLLASPARKIFPVSRLNDTVLGVKCYPDITSIPEAIDLAVLSVPSGEVPDELMKCARLGVQGAAIVSTTLEETSTTLKEQILHARKEYGIRVVGPTCMGFSRPRLGLNASLLKEIPESGNIGFISQTCGLANAVLDWAISSHVGFSICISLDTITDIDFGDLIDFLGNDPYTRSIMIYMEEVGEARKFMSAARVFARNKPIVIMKPGRLLKKNKSSLTDDPTQAFGDRVYDAAFKRVGVIRVKEFTDLFSAATVLDSRNLPRGPRLAVISNAASLGVLAADTLIESGGELASLSENMGNPLDTGVEADHKCYEGHIKACLGNPGADGLLAIYAPSLALNPKDLAEVIAASAKSTTRPILTSFVGGDYVREAREILLRNDVPTYETPEEAVKTYMYMYKYYRNLMMLYETPGELALKEAPLRNYLKVMMLRALNEGRNVLTEEESKEFVFNYGIPGITLHRVRNSEDALTVAERIGYPVLLKIVPRHLGDRDGGAGIKAAIHSAEEMASKYEQLLESVENDNPGTGVPASRPAEKSIPPSLDITLQKMVEKIDYEILLGSKRLRDFGSVITFGIEGIGADSAQDMAVGFPPLNQTLARRLMEETSLFKRFNGFNGIPADHITQLEKILVSFSNLIVDFPEITEIEINPMAVSGGTLCALDARITIDRRLLSTANPYAHLAITPYPTRYVSMYRLPDGSDVTLRPIRPEDEPLELEMLSSLSEAATKTRFFAPLKSFPHEMLSTFCNIDYDREMAIVAESREGDIRRLAGIVRLIIDPDYRSGEYAVLVHDTFQGKGLGYKLMDVIIGIAQEKGLEEIYGTVLSRNHKMLQMARKLGFTLKREEGAFDSDDTTEVTLSLK